MKGFLLYLVQEIKGFDNAECRSYTFADCEEAILIPASEKSKKEHQVNGV